MAGIKEFLSLPPEDDAEMGAEDEKDAEAGSVGKEACAEDMIDAFKRGDKKALIAALDDYLEIWGGPPALTDDADAEA